MPHNPISLDLLKAMDAIDTRGSFAAAAQALHKVPSALTYTIQKVEQDLGIELFDRSGHRAKLTASGRLILDQGRLVLRDIDSLANSAKKIASGWEPELTFCVDTLYESTALFPLIHAFSKENPDIRINLRHGSLSGTWEALLNNGADLIFSEQSLNPKLEGYDTKEIGDVQMTFAVSRDHPLAENACEVTDEMIEDYPIIVVPDSSQIMSPMTKGWTRRNRIISVSTMTEKIAAQQAGLGVGYLPAHRIQAQLTAGDLVLLKISSNPDKAIIAWRKGTPGPALQWFLDHINEAHLGLNPGSQ
jgi:DNA-binding transcriptional LysR family regulator